MQVPGSRAPPSATPEGEPHGVGEVREGAFHVLKASERLMSWEDICQITTRGDLDKLVRHPACWEAYQAWAPAVRTKWGSLEAYIRSYRLGWTDEDRLAIAAADERLKQQRGKEEGAPAILECFQEDLDETMVKVIPNDWPYSVPSDCGHYVVWCRLPIFHESLLLHAASPFQPGPSRDRLYELVLHDGIRGITGEANPPVVHGLDAVGKLINGGADQLPTIVNSSSLPSSNEDVSDASDLRAQAGRIVAVAQEWTGRRVDAYVRAVWPVEEWQTAWFCNPPHLRTVPGLSHFHVIARRKCFKAEA